MAKTLLTIQHNGRVFSPPVKDGVKIEWERTGSPGKLTFTTIKTDMVSMAFQEGDPVCFYYDEKPIFMGYVFTKKRNREQHIDVTCYDQIRYLKNKYTYVFENKTATQIIQALCKDFDVNTGDMENTAYVIPAVAEENKAALDIVLDVLEETLVNTGNMFVLYDNFGELQLKNCANMTSSTLIMEDTAENFDYSSSIDSDTYNSIVLYYTDDSRMQIYTAHANEKIKEWGTLRHFEEIDEMGGATSKAETLLRLYCRKTRELKITGAFGDVTVRGGTLIPVRLNLGDIQINNYLLVEKVTHNFEENHYTMDLTLEGEWNDNRYAGEVDVGLAASKYIGTQAVFPATSIVEIACNGINAYAGNLQIAYVLNGQPQIQSGTSGMNITCDTNSTVTVTVTRKATEPRGTFMVSDMRGAWVETDTPSKTTYRCKVVSNCGFTVKWIEAAPIKTTCCVTVNASAFESFTFRGTYKGHPFEVTRSGAWESVYVDYATTLTIYFKLASGFEDWYIAGTRQATTNPWSIFGATTMSTLVTEDDFVVPDMVENKE